MPELATEDRQRVTTIGAAAKSLGVSAATIERLAADGFIRKVRVGKRRVGILVASLDAYEKKIAEPPPPLEPGSIPAH